MRQTEPGRQARGGLSLRARALDLLARREYSRAELARKLAAYARPEAGLNSGQVPGWASAAFDAGAEAGFGADSGADTGPDSESALDALLDALEAQGLLSDARYVETRLNARGARYGNARLSQELRARGVDAALIESALAACGDEVARAREVWRRKFGAQPPARDAAARAKQARFLMSRGFSGETVRRALQADLDEE